MPVSVEFGSITRSPLPIPYNAVRYHTDTQLYVEKEPPTKILSSFCTARVLTLLLNQFQISKSVSIVPSVLRRIILFDVTQLYVEKDHQIKILSSLCTNRVWTVLLNQAQIVKPESIVPSVLRRAIMVAATQL
jgi:hypothetical protein